jgi:glycosyltransferase 2 family protein
MSKLLRLAVSIILLGWIAWRTNWADVGKALVHIRPEYLLAALVLMILSQLASAKRWQLFARKLNFERPVRQLFAYYLIGMFFNLVLPTSVGGDVVRAWYLDGGTGRRLAAFAAVFLDRFNGLLVLIALACLATVLSPVELPPWIPWCVWGLVGGTVAGLALLPLVARWSWLPPLRREQMQTVLLALRAPRALVGATLLSVFVQVGSVATVAFLGAALDMPVPAIYYGIMVPMVSVLTLLPVSLNGMGVREGGVLLFLAPLGIDEATGLTLAFLWFALTSAVSLFGGLIYLLGAFPKPTKQAPADEPKRDASLAG